MKTFLSIIIPYHERTELLKELIQSIPKASGLEVIVVDDHSSESFSKNYLEKFESYKFIKNKPELRYAGTARNTGIENVSGEYVFFADSDDLIIQDGFLKCLEILYEKKPDILFAKSSSFKDKDGSRGKRHISHNWLIQSVLNKSPVEILARSSGPIAKFIRTEYINQHDIRFETQRYSNDIVFSASLMFYKPCVHVVDEIIYSIREGHQSLISDLSLESSLTRLDTLFRYNALLKKNGLSYLMVPALINLFRLLKHDKILTIIYAWRTITSGFPLFFSIWNLKNIFMRYLNAN
jgi:glycosyltransferase involved in cell wall biosynthesis